ncbi:MAG: hypothetical protein NTW16_12835 [Bacteroidetes bacterium]|nr:hypothetical protein [Bacteroidota bacterium]
MMTIKNRLDKAFGPAGSFAGMIIFIAGIILTYFYLSAAFLILIGGFVGFTSTGSIIEYDKKRIKFSNDIFGFIPTGKWIQILPNMKIGIKESNQRYRAYSQGNRSLDVDKKDFRLILFDSDNKEIMTIKKYKTLDLAKAEYETIGNQMGLVKI